MSISYQKKILFWLITILFPVLILAIIELGLRLSSYSNERQDLFIEYAANTDHLIANPEFVKRYFPTFQPNIAPNPFKKEKAANTLRVFVFGGSSTLGFPHNFYYSFANQLEQKLLLNTNGLNVEVINLGMTAVNSYVIRDLSKRVMPYDPDAVIIYAGHNEFYGSFGVATTQFGLVNSIFVKRLVLSLKNLRLFQVLESVLKGEAEADPEKRTLMAKVIKESNIEIGSDLYNSGVRQFESNIGDVIDLFVDEEIPVFIGTIASNLKDQPPLGENQDALVAYNNAQQLFDEENTTQALKEFEKAKELDGIRFRGPEGINEFILKSSNRTGVNMVDIQKLLRDSSVSSIEDESIFTDHLHPNAYGHIQMAELFYKSILEMQKVKDYYSPNGFNVPQQVSRFEQTHSSTSISRLLVGYPFTKGVTIDEELFAFQKIFQNYISQSYTDSVAASAARNNRLVPLALTDVINRAKEENDSTAVITHYYELLKWQLNSTDLIEKGIEYAVNNRSMDTYLVNMVTQILNDGNYDPRYIDVLSSLYLLNNELDKAGYWLRESEKLDSESARLVYNYARYHILTGDTLKAREYYQKFVNLTQQN